MIDVRTICLSLLSMGEASGYEIKKACEEGPIGCFMDVSFGAIYPALGRLTEEGLIDCRVEAQYHRPDRKVYRLTEAGWAAFRRALLVPPAPDRFRSDFMFLLMFARYIPREHIKEMIDERLAEARAELAALTADCGRTAISPAHEFVRGQGIALLNAMVQHIEQNRHLVEDVANTAYTNEFERLDEPCVWPELRSNETG